jgi:hypothetical protein
MRAAGREVRHAGDWMQECAVPVAWTYDCGVPDPFPCQMKWVILRIFFLKSRFSPKDLFLP